MYYLIGGIFYLMIDKKSNPPLPRDGRVRNWLCIAYPESLPVDWISILDDLHIRWIQSPLHDKDTNPTGELKKAHYHLLFLFDGKKSLEQIKSLLSPLNVPIPIPCSDVRSAVRYMGHMDNPSKYQYPLTDIVPHGGADIGIYLRSTNFERYSLIRDMCSWVRDNGITEFQDLFDYAAENKYDSWFPLLCDNSAYVVGQYIKSQRHRNTTT